MGEQELRDEAREQRAGMQAVGYGCLFVAAVALTALAMTLAAIIFARIERQGDEAVAAYSICEACGLILDTVTRGRREAKRIAYLAVPGPDFPPAA